MRKIQLSIFLIGMLLISPLAKGESQPVLKPDLQKEVDSIRHAISMDVEDTIRVSALLDITYIYYRYNTDSAIKYADLALETSNKANYLAGMSESNGWLGYLYNDKSDFTRGLEYLLAGLELAIKSGNREEQATIMNNIGMSHDFLEDYDMAISYYERALAIHTELGVMHNVGIIIGNLASIENRKGNIKEAYRLNKKALDVFESIDSEANMALTWNNIGNILKQENRYDTALTLFLKSAEVFERFNYNKSLALALANASDCYFQLGNIGLAKKNGERSLEIAQKMGIPESIKNATGFLFKIYKRQGKFEDALAMHELHENMEDSMVNDRNQKEAIRRQLEHNYETQALADSLDFAAQKALEELEHEASLKSERSQRYMLYGGIGFLLILGLVTLRAYQRKRKDHEVISEQKRQTEFQKEQIEEAHKEITDSIAYAKRIQTAILPPNALFKEHLKQSFILYKPKDIVAGDFYWMETVGNTVFFAAADCTGHGVPGAMVSVICVNGLNRSVREFGLTEPGQILDKCRELVIKEFEKSSEEVKDGMDISLCALNTSNGELKWAGANNPLWIVRNGSNEIEEIKADKQPIGKYDLAKPFNTHELTLSEGDTIYLFSDGYPDQFGGDRGKKYKSANFKKKLIQLSNESIDHQGEILDQEFETWKGELEQIDDVCVIGVKIS